ncbi:hypothetical protein M8494_00005 [Serratia ureilytica]
MLVCAIALFASLVFSAISPITAPTSPRAPRLYDGHHFPDATIGYRSIQRRGCITPAISSSLRWRA